MIPRSADFCDLRRYNTKHVPKFWIFYFWDILETSVTERKPWEEASSILYVTIKLLA